MAARRSWIIRAGGHGSADVVDGQQRLTTIVLLLDAIAREIDQVGTLSALSQGIRSNYIAVVGMHGQPIFRLTLNPDTHDFFRTEVVAASPLGLPPTIASHRRLAEAHERFRTYLAEHRGPGQQEWLLNLYGKVTQRLRLTIYEVSEAAEVGVIFEVMNDRGKPLTELEKVKNYLLYVASRLGDAGASLRDEVNQSWAQVFERLMQAGLHGDGHENALLRAHWLVNFDPSPGEWNGAKSIKKRFGLRDYVGRDSELLADLIEYARRLRASVVAYADVQRPHATGAFNGLAADERTTFRIQRVSEQLVRMRLTATFTPLFVGLRLAAPKDAATYRTLVELAEQYAYLVYRLLERRSDTGASSISRMGFDLVHGHDAAEIIERLKGALRYYAPADRITETYERAERNWYGWRGLRYFLYEYEEHLASGAYVPLAWEKVDGQELEKTIEHVLPQTPTDKYWTSRFSSTQRKLLTHSLGNLALTEFNPTLSNKPFPAKRDGLGDAKHWYAKSSIRQEFALAQYLEWTPSAVNDRRDELVAWALGRWPIPAAPIDPQAEQMAEDEEVADVQTLGIDEASN